jgi:hypothetical protein
LRSYADDDPGGAHETIISALFSVISILTLAALLDPTAALAAGGGHVDADLDLGAPMDGGSLALGIGGRFGWRFDFGPVWLQPEAGGQLHQLSRRRSNGDEHIGRVLARRPRLPRRALGGAGLIAGIIEPALFGHAGYGWISSTLSGPAFDAGFALDVKVVRHFSFGAHGAFNDVSAQTGFIGVGPLAFRWISYGLHAGVSF